MADPLGTVNGFFSTILGNPFYLLLTIGGLAFFALLVVAHHIHKIHSEEIFVHQAWGGNWKGRWARETLISRGSYRGGPVGVNLSNVPEGLRYTKDHEWAKLEGKRARIGITDFAQDQLTDVVYVELPPIGKAVKQGEPIRTVEAVKAVREIFAPITGTDDEVNKRS